MSDIVKEPRDAFNLLVDMREYLRPLHSQMDEQFNLREGKINFKVPDGFDKHVTSTGFDKVQDGINHVMSLKLRAEVPEKTATQKAEKQSGILTSWFNDKFFTMLPRSDYIDPVRQYTTNIFTYGMAVLEGPYWNYNEWPDEPEQDKGESDEEYKRKLERYKLKKSNCFPFIIRVPDPRIIFFDPSYPMSFCFKTYTRKAISVKQSWPLWDMTLDGMHKFKPMDDVTWCEYWDIEKRLFWIQDGPFGEANHVIGMPIPEIDKGKTVSGFRENVYGFLPFIIKFSGIGSITPDADLCYRAVGLLDHVAGDLKAESRLTTAIDSATELSSWNNLAIAVDDLPADYHLDFSPGVINELPGKALASIRNLNTPVVTADTYRHLSQTTYRIQKATFPDSFSGLRQADTAYQEEALIGQAKGKLIPFLQPIEQAFSEFAANALKVVDTVIEEPIWGVSAKDINGYYSVDVKFDARTPEETDRRKALGIRIAPSGLLSKRTIRSEYLDVNDPDKEQTQILVEMAQQNPQVIQALVAGALKDWGAEKFIKQLQEKQELLNVKPSGGGITLNPNQPMAPMAQGGGNVDIRTMRRAVPTATQLGGEGEQELVQ